MEIKFDHTKDDMFEAMGVSQERKTAIFDKYHVLMKDASTGRKTAFLECLIKNFENEELLLCLMEYILSQYDHEQKQKMRTLLRQAVQTLSGNHTTH